MESSESETGRAARLLGSLTQRPAVEPAIFVGLAFIFIWVIRPTEHDWLKVPFLAVIVAIPFASNYMHRDRLPALGIRVDNLWSSALEVGLFTAIMALSVLLIGISTGTEPTARPDIGRSILLSPMWGLIQQYAMQSFTYRRLREGTHRPVVAAALTALLFASLHYPNAALALATLVGGFFWCLLFERTPNLFTLALSHGWLAILLRASWPAEWLHNLRIGPSFWTW